MDHTSSLVNLSIPKDVTTPIVAAKIQEAVLAALGGQEKIISGVIHEICNRKVDSSGNTPRYDSDAKHTWIDYHVTQIIQKEIEVELKNQMKLHADGIKEALVKELQSKKGATKVAQGLLDSLNGSFTNAWNSKISVQFNSKE